MASPAKKAESEKTWIDALTSELGYVGMICLTIFLYAIVALLSLAPDGTIGKLSPIHEAVQRNTYLSRMLEITGINRATNTQLVVISIILFWIGFKKTVVLIVDYTIFVCIPFACIAYSILIRVFLIRIVVKGAIITEVSKIVIIPVFLARISDLFTVIACISKPICIIIGLIRIRYI